MLTFAQALSYVGDGPHVRRVRRAREACGVVPADQPVVFHGTSASRLDAVLRGGLLPRSERGWNTAPSIAFSADPDMAVLYVDEAAGRDGDECGGVVAFRVDPADPSLALDDDAWSYVVEEVLAAQAEGWPLPALEALKAIYPDSATRSKFFDLCTRAGAEPTECHEVALEALLPRGQSVLALSVALNVQGRIRRPVPASEWVGAWRLAPGDGGYAATPLVGSVSPWTLSFATGEFLEAP
jgi:hypothetical protein